MNSIELSHVTGETLVDFRDYLLARERSETTIERYLNDVRTLLRYISENGETKIDKTVLIAFKEWLWEHYKPASCNTMIAGVNQFLKSMGADELTLRPFKQQNRSLRTSERLLSQQEFKRLLDAARASGRDRLAAAMEAIAMTGIRISELRFFTIESVRKGQIRVRNKGKIRLIPLPGILIRNLKGYAAKHSIRNGCLFITATGKCVDRSNFWREMQSLKEIAHVGKEKLFPHNIRHLFAHIYYRATKDLVGLGDILGHSSLNVTRIYTMKTFEMQRKTLDKINFAFIKNTGLVPA